MKGLLSAARKKTSVLQRNASGTLDKNGSTASVKWERLDNLSPTTTAMTQIEGNQSAFFGRSTVLPATTNVTATMAKYGQAVLLTEEIDFYQMNLRAARFVDNPGANAGESLNLLMESVFSGASRSSLPNGAVGGGTADTNVTSVISLNDIKWSVNTLNRWSAMQFTTPAYGSQNYNTNPVRASYYGIAHVDVEEDIRSITGFIPVEQYGGYTETMPFEFGAVGGVRWCSTEIIPVTTGGGTTSAGGIRGASSTQNDIYSTYIYGKEAVGSVGLGNMHATNAYEMYNPKNPPAVELITKAPGRWGLTSSTKSVRQRGRLGSLAQS